MLKEFLLFFKKDTTAESILTTTLADINNTGVDSSLADFQKTKVFNKEEVITYFKREILKLCKDKTNLSYWELVVQIYNNVLFIDTWNSNIGGKYFKGKIHE